MDKAGTPDVSKLDGFCVVCISGSSCERPHCYLFARKQKINDSPLDLSTKGDVGFKKPMCTPKILKESLRKRPTSLPIGSMNARTAFILDRDKRVHSTSGHPYVKQDLPYLSGFGNLSVALCHWQFCSTTGQILCHHQKAAP